MPLRRASLRPCHAMLPAARRRALSTRRALLRTRFARCPPTILSRGIAVAVRLGVDLPLAARLCDGVPPGVAIRTENAPAPPQPPRGLPSAAHAACLPRGLAGGHARPTSHPGNPVPPGGRCEDAPAANPRPAQWHGRFSDRAVTASAPSRPSRSNLASARLLCAIAARPRGGGHRH